MVIPKKKIASRSEFYSSRDHTRPLRVSVALAVIPTLNARRFQRTHTLRGVGSSLNASKGIAIRVLLDFAPTCGSEPVMDAWFSAAVGSARTGRVLDAGSDREDRSCNVCCVGDTRHSSLPNRVTSRQKLNLAFRVSQI